MVRSIYVLACIAILGCSLAAMSSADELRLAAPRLLQTSVPRDVRLAEDGQSIVLERGVLYEDDGPAAGYCYGPNEEKLGPGVKIRKQLVVANPQADRAFLLIGGSGPFEVAINGQQTPLVSAGKAGNYWQQATFSAGLLKPGLNDFVLSGTGKLWIARDEDFAAGSRERTRHPNRSAKSTDDGKTWQGDKLGPAGDLDGEYYVRLFLDQFRAAGSLMLPVLDAGNLAGQPIAPALESVPPLQIAVRGSASSKLPIVASVRTGTTVVPGEKTWSKWQPLGSSDATLDKPAGRYFQLKLELSTSDPLQTPALDGLTIRATPQPASQWHEKLRVVENINPTVVRTSIPFEYEPFDQPRLAEFRQQHQLDDVAIGAKDELDLIAKLAAWSSQRWEKGHLSQIYPAWDALEILKSHSDGQPIGGFCQQYNLVFLQACESLGLVGRAVSLGPDDAGLLKIRGGHEVVEIWSNQFGKWIYVDGNAAWYFVDAASRTPLSLCELRERQLHVARQQPSPAVEIVRLAETRYEWTSLTSWPPFAELRLIPRSNFLAERSPLPLNQGMRGWFWTGHYVLSDELSSPSRLYAHRVSQPANWDWTLNQAHIHLSATATPGELRVELDSETPGLETYLVDLDGAGRKPSSAAFNWKLHRGTNRLDVRPRNIAGREGMPSAIAVEYDG